MGLRAGNQETVVLGGGSRLEDGLARERLLRFVGAKGVVDLHDVGGGLDAFEVELVDPGDVVEDRR